MREGQDELYSLYQRKDVSYKELTAQARASMRELVRQMKNTICDSPVIETQMLQLARELKNVSGKKVYGYLKKPLKEQVDAVVDELAKVPAVAECYEVWNGLRDECKVLRSRDDFLHNAGSTSPRFLGIVLVAKNTQNQKGE